MSSSSWLHLLKLWSLRQTRHGSFRGRALGLILSGGHIDPRLLASVITCELIREERIVTLRFVIADQPGLLAEATARIGDAGANILEIRRRRTSLTVPAREADIELTFEARDADHAKAVIEALHAAGFHRTIIPI